MDVKPHVRAMKIIIETLATVTTVWGFSDKALWFIEFAFAQKGYVAVIHLARREAVDNRSIEPT